MGLCRQKLDRGLWSLKTWPISSMSIKISFQKGKFHQTRKEHLSNRMVSLNVDQAPKSGHLRLCFKDRVCVKSHPLTTPRGSLLQRRSRTVCWTHKAIRWRWLDVNSTGNCVASGKSVFLVFQLNPFSLLMGWKRLSLTVGLQLGFSRGRCSWTTC